MTKEAPHIPKMLVSSHYVLHTLVCASHFNCVLHTSIICFTLQLTTMLVSSGPHCNKPFLNLCYPGPERFLWLPAGGEGRDGYQGEGQVNTHCTSTAVVVKLFLYSRRIYRAKLKFESVALLADISLPVLLDYYRVIFSFM